MSDIFYNTDDYSLNQGVKFNLYQNDYANIIGKKRLDLIEETTSSDLLSLRENMESIQKPITKKTDSEITMMKTLEAQFNSTLQQYKDTYKQYLDSEVQNKDLTQMYKNQNVKSPSGDYYYVNEYGYTRGYGNDAWNNKPSSCYQSIPNDNTKTIYSKLQHGVNYVSGQPCDLDGKNIRNTQTGHLAWVGPNGVKHFYPNEEILQAAIKNGCPSSEVKVSNEIYDMYPSGENMTQTTKCFENTSGDGMMNQIVTLNSKLISIAQEMYNLLDNIENEEEIVDKKLDSEKVQLQHEINNLETEKHKLEKLQNAVNRLDGELEQTNIITNMEYLQYMGWTVGAIGLAILAAKHITS